MAWPRGTVALAAALLFAACAALLFGLSPTLHPIDAIRGIGPMVEVPDLHGLAQPRAEADLDSVGLDSEISTAFSLSSPRGAVISQDPAPGTEIRSGSTVEVVVSEGIIRVEMPDAVGRPLSEAAAPLDDAGVAYSVEERPNETVASGFVVAQTPLAGRTITASESVSFVVSTGPLPREIPDVLGLSSEGAAYSLGVTGLFVGEVTEAESSAEAGVVLESDPAAGGTLARDSPVNLVVSAGIAPLPIPDVIGLAEDEAIVLLRDVGLTASIVNAGASPGRVTSVDPAAGTVVPAGSVVRVGVSSG